MEKIGLDGIDDRIGNIWARRKGTGGGAAAVVFAAHMDTVHPMNTSLKVTRKNDGTLHAPGVFDNSASVVNMLQAARAMHAAKVRTRGDIILLFTVQEELGLKGMYYWLDKNKKVADMLVALDGGLGPVNYGALGIYWSKMQFTAAGAHTKNSRDQPNPARAAAQCITDIYTVPLPASRTRRSIAVYNVGGMMTGGNVVNAIPQEVTFTVDLRTVDPDLLNRSTRQILAKCEAAAGAQGRLRARIHPAVRGGRPARAAADRREHPLVQTAIDVLGTSASSCRRARSRATGSTDANAGVVQGIPSISVGRSRGGDQHTLQEWATLRGARSGRSRSFFWQ